MQNLARTNYFSRYYVPSPRAALHLRRGREYVPQLERIRQELRDLHVTAYAIKHFESHGLARILRTDEHIKAAVHGLSGDGEVMFIATNDRIVCLYKHPTFIEEELVPYEMIDGVGYERTRLRSVITLRTSRRQYKVWSYNSVGASDFVAYIEPRCVKKQKKGAWYDNVAQKWFI